MSSADEKIDKDAVNREAVSRIVPVYKGLEQCCEELYKKAIESREVPPENTRSNPADRIKRFREETNWETSEKAEVVLKSKMYKQSAILLIHCVLSSLYGKNIYLKSDRFESLKNQNTELKGRSYFLERLQKSLYGECGLKMDEQNLIRIYYDEKLIGLFSSSGPIPSIDCPFLVEDSEDVFIKNLKIDDTVGIGTLLNALNAQERQLIKFYLDKNIEAGNCALFQDIRDNFEKLKEDVAYEIQSNFETDSSIPFSFPTVKDDSGEKNADILAKKLIVLPIYDSNAKIGYSFVDTLETLRFSTGRDSQKIWYACIPPLAEKAISLIDKGRFRLTHIHLKDEKTTEEKGKITSIFIECRAELDGIKFYYSRRYSGEKINYLNNFPVLDLYGIAPKFGFLARRNIEVPENDRKQSPLENEKKIDVGKLRDVEIGKTGELNFESIDDKYQYCLHTGNIPEWAGIKVRGNWCGALPLRAGYVKDENWEDHQPFVHKEFPKNNIMNVALDIGSSRSIVLFEEGIPGQGKYVSTLIEKGQDLAIPIIHSMGDEDDAFRREYFQFTKSYKNIEGKKPLSIAFTNRQDDSKTLLYESGKLFFLDANMIENVGKRTLISAIKCNIGDKKSNSTNSTKAMIILVQGLLSLIIARSIRAGCSKINIRTAYLVEQYGSMRDIWKEAIKGFENIISEANLRTINNKNKNLEIISNGGGKLSIEVTPYLPESLAVANELCVSNFEAGSGAAIIDIGDYSTDIAIFKNADPNSKDSAPKSYKRNVELFKNLSIYFGGRLIFLQAIWDYLRTFLKHGVSDNLKKELKDIFNLEISDKARKYKSSKNSSDENRKNEEKSDDAVFIKLIDELEKNGSMSMVNNDVRNALFCVIPRMVDNSNNLRNAKLKDLIDLGYLAEMLILKHCINEIKGKGVFNVYLFGGGSFCFRGQRVGNNDGGFGWKEVLNGRDCKIYNKHSDVDMLASGLFRDINPKIEEAAFGEETIALNGNGNKGNDAKFSDNEEELRETYRKFLESAKKMKGDWSFAKNKDGTRNFAGCKLDENGEFIRDKKGKIQGDPDVYKNNHDASLSFASECMPYGGDSEIFKILFAYRMAYLNISQQYEKYGDS